MTAVQDGTKKRGLWVLFSIAFATFMVNADSYIVNISLPVISGYFKVGTEAVSWVVMSYQLTVTALLLVFGTLGDRIGIKRLFMLGYAVFTVSSLFCAVSPTLGWLVASRALQGIGASVLYALTPAMVPRYLPPEQRGPAFGALATAAALGISVGTPLGGLITGLLSWHWAFLINIPIGIVAMLVAKRVLPADLCAAEKASLPAFDYVGSAFSALALVSLIYSFSKLNSLGLAPTVLGAAVLFVASLMVFVLWERKVAHPLLDYSLFRSPAFNYGNLANFLCLCYLAGHNFITPFYLMTVKGLPTERAGTVFLLYSLIYMGMGPLAGQLSKRVNPRILCTTALLAGVLVSFGFSLFLNAEGMLPVYGYFVGLALVMATFIPSNNNVVMGMAPPGKQGAVSGSFRMVGRVGMTVGVCLFQTIFALAALQAGKLHADALKAVERTQLLSAFSTVYAVGAVLFAVAAVSSLLAREGSVVAAAVE
ncbi:DHA2 family efflux MFS transporter permease subunit [Trichlorobacter lovleyi]|uniref:Drug resistance transporter, EmrB/QacA subfamily n=1 Tax=Trichlorobacter lovleyi (strain ATCC BAA-1151 / DSM 17278 / SZ) TaxID=398767 RepID=B3E5C0_TRIL1|nr:DHA2 family efflux MFS transporter permease subunit [Trichlorobacter lovleyi]ACD96107.1 drug resistance transporter, EmrB/QacA subfamily [Trichlorobacter lovleyi SZ]